MLKYAKRFLARYNHTLGLGIAFATFLTLFYKPLHFIFIESETEEFKNNPIVVKAQKEREERKELIIKTYKAYKECKDPEEKKKLFETLSKIHQNRLLNSQREQFNSPHNKD